MSWSLRTDSSVELVVHGPARPTRRVAVVLHGVGSTADFALRCLAPALSDLGYDVVAPDLRGHAGSTPLPDPADHSLDHHLADLSAIAERVDVGLVAGISLGAEIALRWLASGGEVDGAVLCLPGVVGPESLPAAANRHSAAAVAAVGVPAFLAAMDGATGALSWVVDEVRASWTRHDPASLIAALRSVAEEQPTPARALEVVRTPVGVVAVEDDVGHPAAAADQLVAGLTSAHLTRIRLADLADDRALLGRVGVAAMLRASASR